MVYTPLIQEYSALVPLALNKPCYKQPKKQLERVNIVSISDICFVVDKSDISGLVDYLYTSIAKYEVV